MKGKKEKKEQILENYVKNVISQETTCHFGAMVISRHLHNITRL